MWGLSLDFRRKHPTTIAYKTLNQWLIETLQGKHGHWPASLHCWVPASFGYICTATDVCLHCSATLHNKIPTSSWIYPKQATWTYNARHIVSTADWLRIRNTTKAFLYHFLFLFSEMKQNMDNQKKATQEPNIMHKDPPPKYGSRSLQHSSVCSIRPFIDDSIRHR